MDEEEKETTEDECVTHAILESMREDGTLLIYDENSNASSNSSGELKIDTEEPSTSKKRSSKRKRTPCSKIPVPEDIDFFEEEIEEQLGSKAKKSKLTVTNVKNILKHVITNQHVMAMVKQSMRESGDVASSDEEFPYEPKLTRAKTKELQTKFAWPVTPSKAPPASETKKLIEGELPEDEEDDEEYQPVEEEELSDDENTSLASDLEPLTPQSLVTTPTKSNADCSTQTTWTDDGLFRVPTTQDTEPESIVHRTRSKLCLSETPLETIEKAFIPPDITTDMYDYEYDNEDYIKFLEEFTQPLNNVLNETIDDEEDPEYNILEDEEAEDKEELRADRAVKVPKKEVNELIAELLEFLEPDDEDETENGNDISQSSTGECSFSALQQKREGNQSSMYMSPQSAYPQAGVPVRIAPVPPVFSPSAIMSPAAAIQSSPVPMRSPLAVVQTSPIMQTTQVIPTTPSRQNMTVPTVQSSPLPVVQTVQVSPVPVALVQNSPVPVISPARTPMSSSQQGIEEGNFILPDRVAEAYNAGTGVVQMTHQQQELLAQQMRQHVQLLTQCYMQSVILPEMNCCSSETKENLLSLKFLSGCKSNSAFNVSNLNEALKVVEEWDNMFVEGSLKYQEIKEFLAGEKERRETARKKKKCYVPQHSRLFMETVSQSKAFIYPLLLPLCPFVPPSKLHLPLHFTDSENILLVIGLEQFLPLIEKTPEYHSKRKAVTMEKVSDMLSEYLLPAKTSRSIKIHIAVMKRSPKTLISKFFFENKVPMTKHFVIDIKHLAPCEQPRDLLPEIWRKFIYKET